MEGFIIEVVVGVVEVGGWEVEKNLLELEDISKEIEDTLEIVEEAYSHGYIISILVAKVGSQHSKFAMVSNAFEGSIGKDKYYKV